MDVVLSLGMEIGLGNVKVSEAGPVKVQLPVAKDC
jgi:hypothetical protein